MSLSKYDTRRASDEGRFLHLEFDGRKLLTEDDGPDGKPKQMGLMVKGSNSSDFRRREKDLQAQRQERVRLKKGGRIGGLDDMQSAQRELYAAMVTEYVNLGDEWDGLDPTLQNTLLLFERFPWVEEQVIDFVENEANFLGEP